MSLKDYVRLGLNHHLLYADCASEPSEHQRTLMGVVKDDRLEILDIWIPEVEPYRSEEVKAIRQSGKQIYYNVGTREGKEPAHPASLDPGKKRYSIDFYKSELDRAIECGATKIITNSGPNNPKRRKEAIDALIEFYVEICSYVPDKLVMIEPTDWDVSKCKLIGSSKEAVDVCEHVRQAGCANMASMVDMGHVALMHETIEQAMRDTGDYIGHIHLGNCILKDRTHKLFGDKHPALCIEGGEYGIDELARLFEVGLDIGYFNPDSRGSASIEMRTLEGKSAEECLDLYYRYVCQAWDKAVE